jgi:predicted N-acetyltransferase YhbS
MRRADTTTSPVPTLADGLVLRGATEDDIDGIVALNVAAFGEQDGPDVHAFLADPEILRAWSVVADGARVASAVARIDHRMQLDGLEFPTAQIEYVATDESYQRRGLVAAQMQWHHDACREAGIAVQMIGGIPYFYRRFGYGYGLEDASLFLFDRDQVNAIPTPGMKVRIAARDDVDAILCLEDERPTEGLRVLRDERAWLRVLGMCAHNDWADIFVAEDDDDVVGWARIFDHPKESRTFLLPSVARSPAAVTALVRAALDRAGDNVVIGFDSPGTVFAEQLRVLGSPFLLGLGYYVRIPDPIAFLELLQPVLSRRLAASDLAEGRGTVEISLYSYGIALDYEEGAVTGVRKVPGVEDPTDVDGIGVAPDWFPALALGRWKATDLAKRVDDVLILRDHHLMNVLFPYRTSDVSGDF